MVTRFVRLFCYTFLGLYYAQSLIAFLSFQGAKKSVLQLPIRQAVASIIVAEKSFQLARKKILVYSSSKNFTCPSGKLRTEFDSPIAKSTTPEYQTPVSLHAVILILLRNKNVTVVNKKQRIESVR